MNLLNNYPYRVFVSVLLRSDRDERSDGSGAERAKV